jgi:hypothetical protein
MHVRTTSVIISIYSRRCSVGDTMTQFLLPNLEMLPALHVQDFPANRC